MKNREYTLLVALALLVSSPVSTAGQALKKKPTAAAANRTEPLRVIGGELHASTISGQVTQGWRPTTFSFTLTKAEIVADRLRLSGDFALHLAQTKMSDKVTATIGGVVSKASNPWPSARQERRTDAKKSKEEQKAGEQQQGREARNHESASQLGQLAQSTQDTARKTPAASGVKTEQTQTLYADSETSSSCGLVFLRLTLPRQLRSRLGATTEPLQLGVVLKPFDNKRGEEIVKQVCLLLQTSSRSANLDQLNRLLLSSK